ncbi:biotin synthase [Nitratifractor sp.]
MQKPIFLCAINNVQSGSCPEDCRFCAQSARYRAPIERYGFKSPEQVLAEARRAVANGAIGYCLVTAGKGLDDAKTETLARLASALRREFPDLGIIACCGTAEMEQLRHLKAHGVTSYNHNLETSREFYPTICTTHDWEERYATCEAVHAAGLALCCGGILGLGESATDRQSLLESIASLRPASVPLNFYIPNPALPIKERTVDLPEALAAIRMMRTLLGEAPRLMVAGGREQLFGGKEREMFDAGADAIVIGDYLTTPGEAPDRDRRTIEALGYTIARSCDGR